MKKGVRCGKPELRPGPGPSSLPNLPNSTRPQSADFPPAALTSVMCNGCLPRLFSSFSVRHLSSSPVPLCSSSLVFRNLSPLRPLPIIPISRPPHLPETGAAEPAVFGGRRKRRKFPGGISPEQRRCRGDLRCTLKTAGNGTPANQFRPQTTERVGAFWLLRTRALSDPICFGLGRKKGARGG